MMKGDLEREVMNLRAYFLTLTFSLIAGSALATPYYVGTNVAPKNNLSGGFNYTPTKKTFSTTRKTGTITKYTFKGDYLFRQDRLPTNVRFGFDLPLYWADRDATNRKAGYGFGGVNLYASLGQRLSESVDDVTWGYLIKLDFYLPTTSDREALAVQKANVPLEMIRFGRGWASAQPTFTIFTENGDILLKAGAGVAYSYIVKNSAAAVSATRKDQNRYNIPIQAGATFKWSPDLAFNAEYNTMILDKPTRALMAVGTKNTRFRQLATVSVSGTWWNFLTQVYASVPVDAASRRTSIFNAGANLGVTF